jgi:hypothetical protein
MTATSNDCASSPRNEIGLISALLTVVDVKHRGVVAADASSPRNDTATLHEGRRGANGLVTFNVLTIRASEWIGTERAWILPA